MSGAVHRLLEASSFAARAHAGQLRKDGATPYASHPVRVCLVARLIFNVADPDILTAALLHDTVEDTTTDYDDISERFGEKVAGWVRALTKDKRLPEAEREEVYVRTVADAGWPVQVLKLADIYDNLCDCVNGPAEKRHKTVERSRFYLDRLDSMLATEARAAFDIVRQLLDDGFKRK